MLCRAAWGRSQRPNVVRAYDKAFAAEVGLRRGAANPTYISYISRHWAPLAARDGVLENVGRISEA